MTTNVSTPTLPSLPSSGREAQALGHVIYEIRMLRWAATSLIRKMPPAGEEKNALIETFAMHSRVLIHFFYPTNPHLSDVLAEDYCESKAAWRAVRPSLSEALSRVRGRVGKEIVHLTYERLDLTEEAKQWDIPAILRGLQSLIELFASTAKQHLISPLQKAEMLNDPLS